MGASGIGGGGGVCGSGAGGWSSGGNTRNKLLCYYNILASLKIPILR